MKIRNAGGQYTQQFKEWVAALWMKGFSAGQIAKFAHDEFEEQAHGISRNSMIGLVHRIGAGSKRLENRNVESYEPHGMRTAWITLSGPEYSIPDLPNVRRAA
jgi:hypothetical protein